ncbi:TraR/DksA family transcriptional regulator [Vulgatibacter sp.]|uniref:TraR/DksA family transcriptional regulator n=1 Tax=Vulgatibacter sp. TaxID=1971226 RepID=UPI00356166A9
MDDEQARERLEALRAELEAQLRANAEGARPVDLDQPIGRVSRVDALQQQQMAQAARRRDELRLQQVRAALGRLQRGEYGDCLRCEEPIGAERLQVKPEAAFCMACQAGAE